MVRPKCPQDRFGGGAQVAGNDRLFRPLPGVGSVRRRHIILPPPLALAAKRAAFPGSDPQRPGERIALRVVLARPREHAQQRSLRRILRVRHRDVAGGERAEPRPQQGKRRPESRTIALGAGRPPAPPLPPPPPPPTPGHPPPPRADSPREGPTSPHRRL